MSIKVESDSIYIDDEIVSFEDIYKSASTSGFGVTKAKKIGDNCYYFDYDFYIGKDSPAGIKDTNVKVIIDGEYFQIYEGSFFQLGEIDNGIVVSGGSIDIPNIKLAYGFGCKDKDDVYSKSGDLFLYGSQVNIPGFWAFFNKPDKQKVEVVDCIINGFGRFSGTDSFFRNITFIKSTTKYGTISTLGRVKSIENIKLNSTDSDCSAIYYNPKISGDCIISNFVSYHHDVFVYCEKGDSYTELNLIDPQIPSDNKIEFKDENAGVSFSYSVEFLSQYNDLYIQIFDSDEDEIEAFTLNYSHKIVLKNKTITSNGTSYFNPYKVIIDKVKTIYILPNQPITINVDLFYQRNRRANDDEFFLINQTKLELGTLAQFFVKAYSTPTVELYKFNGVKIAEPFKIEKVNGILYRVDYLLGDLGDVGLNGEKWLDGQYYFKGSEEGSDKTFYKSITLERFEEYSDESGAVRIEM